MPEIGSVCDREYKTYIHWNSDWPGCAIRALNDMPSTQQFTTRILEPVSLVVGCDGDTLYKKCRRALFGCQVLLEDS